jgi:hypothetical protein
MLFSCQVSIFKLARNAMQMFPHKVCIVPLSQFLHTAIRLMISAMPHKEAIIHGTTQNNSLRAHA